MHERQSSGSNCARIGLSQRRADCNQVISAPAIARKRRASSVFRCHLLITILSANQVVTEEFEIVYCPE
jgi:hypothetical protein